MAASRFEVHHRVPRCLLGFFDRAASGELDAAGLQAWFEWEEEAFRYSVDPDISREDLVGLIDSSLADPNRRAPGRPLASRRLRPVGQAGRARYARSIRSTVVCPPGAEALGTCRRGDARPLSGGAARREDGGSLMAAPLFPLGRVVATPGALNALVKAGQEPGALLQRHQAGDWGGVQHEDAEENRRSVRYGWRVLSSYTVGSNRIWIITEADRSSTCLLLPKEY